MSFHTAATPRSIKSLFLLAMASVCLSADSAPGQRVRFPAPIYPYPTTTSPWTPAVPTTSPDPSVANPGAAISGGVNPGVTLNGQIMPFDPYALPTRPSPPPFGTPPAALPPAIPATPGGPTYQPPYLPPTSATFPPPANVPPVLPPNYGTTGPPAPLNGTIYGPEPTPVFPEGLPWTQSTNGGPYQRLLQDTGARYTYLYSNGDPTALGINEVELTTSLVFHRFARSASGLRLTPGFVFDFIDGPSQGSDLPPQLYSAYLDAAWRPQITPQFAADLRFRTGVYSDFRTVTSDSVRFTGTGLGVIQMTPTTALKLGVEYLDRLDVKLLPAFGIYWEPNPQARYDIYFPRPKLSRYWTTLRNSEVWWYVGGEYGGGSWSIDRPDDPLAGVSDRIDINDIRVFVGIDWSYLDQRSGFLEIGYVFERELLYDLVPAESLNLDNTFMVGAGILF